MKTNEFIKEVKAMGFEVDEDKDTFFVKNGCGSVLAYICKYESFTFSTGYNIFFSLDENKKQQLFNLLTKYASTPIEEREEEKKYMYRVKRVDGLNYDSMDYLNYNNTLKTCFLDDSRNGIFKTKFTHSELKSLGVDIEQLQEVYEEIEVEEE